MRVFLPVFFSLITLFAKAQNQVDSVLSKSWYSSLNAGVVFNKNPQQGANYLVNENFIVFPVRRTGNNDTIKYTYHGDSLVLYPKTRNQYYDFVWCHYRPSYLEEEMQPKWVFYSESYAKSLPVNFKKLSISPWQHGTLEIDSSGEAFYKTRDIEETEMYGHYRYQLDSLELEKFLNLIQEESLEIEYIQCNRPLIVSNSKKKVRISYQSQDKEYSYKRATSIIERHDLRIFKFIRNIISLEKMQFQNFADGDSLKGIVYYPFVHGNVDLLSVKLNYLTNYTYQRDTFYLYQAFADTLYYSEDSAFNHLTNLKPIYFKSIDKLDSGKYIISSENIPNRWFERGSRFVKPRHLIFKNIINYELVPKDFKPIVTISYDSRAWNRDRWWEYQPTNAFLKFDHQRGFYTLWGLPYPFLRPNFQVAFEEYVLPDWKAYLKSIE